MLVAIALSACDAEEAQVDSGPVGPCPDGTTLDWTSFAEVFFVTWCRSCHSSALAAPYRGGAPPGLDFDDYDDVVSRLQVVAAAATGDAPTMPVGGGPTAEQREDLAEWITCGAPL